MFATRFVRCFLTLAVLFCWPLAVRAQTITLTNGVQKYASLASTTVNMSGRCELWVTNSSTPLSGCTINLNSIDAWLFLPGVKPSVVASTYLGQVSVNGASAVADTNVVNGSVLSIDTSLLFHMVKSVGHVCPCPHF